MKILKRIGIGLLSLIGILLVVIIGYVGYMQMHYYRIPDNRKLSIKNNQSKQLSLHHLYSIITYNVGFGAYNHNFDFFMDKGELKNGTKTQGTRGTAFSKQSVLASTDGAIKTMKKQNPDFMLFQEIDTHSTRSHYVNQVNLVEHAFKNYDHVFANNFHSAYLAWPLYDPHGSVQSGLLSMSKYHMQSAVRKKYPVSSAFISKFTDLDRCFTVMHYPIKGGKELIVINSHMSAYDKGGKMRKAQMKILSKVIEAEYKAGNYVIVGGDFNHALGRDMLTHFDHQEKIPSWVSVLDQKMLPKDFIMVKATNRERVATVRSTDMKYRPKVNYQTVGDGFIISKNIKAKATDINTDYRYADHNPVRLGFSLK
jgi:endonuclease/exonuclease/phosphatase family metal-dependent hydrolase